LIKDKREKIAIPLSKLPKSSTEMISRLLSLSVNDPINDWRLKPMDFIENELGWRFPPKIMEWFEYLFHAIKTKSNIRIVIIGPRGGGKTAGFGMAEYVLSFLYDFDFLNLAGSLNQAKVIHAYQSEFMEKTDFKNVKSDGILQTVFVSGAWLSCVACSSTEARSKHPGGTNIKTGDKGGHNPALMSSRKEYDQNVPEWDYVQMPTPGKYDAGGKRVARGGGLVVDEECEADPDVVKSALPIVNSAMPSIIMRGSTFHELDGSFQDVVDHAEERGYKLFSWDIFDVMQSCPYDCKECYPEFSQDAYEEIIDPDTGKLITRNLRKAYCGGKAKNNPNGFIRAEEIFQVWIECGFDKEWFEVEYMGRRPSAKETKLAPYADIIFTDENIIITPDMPAAMGIDWGMEAGHKVIIAAPKGIEGNRYLVLTESLANKSCSDICKDIENKHLKNHKSLNFYADAENAYNNDDLKALRQHDNTPIRFSSVQFATTKRSMLFPNLLAHMQSRTLIIPRAINGFQFPARTIKNLKRKLKRYRLEPRGVRKMQGMDEIDALMLALSHWGGVKRVDTKYRINVPVITGGHKMTNFGNL